MSLDLVGEIVEGEKLDSSQPTRRAKVFRAFDDDQFEMVIVPPVRGLLNSLQGLNYCKVNLEQVDDKFRQGAIHFRFVMFLCTIKPKRNRLFTFKHPVQARSWTIETANVVMNLLGAVAVDLDVCHCGVIAEGHDGKGLANKRTRVFTNSTKSAQRLLKAQCCGNHGHVSLTN